MLRGALTDRTWPGALRALVRVCGVCAEGLGHWYISTSAPLGSLFFGGEPVFRRCFYFWPPFQPGVSVVGVVVEDSCRVIMGRGNRQAWIFQAERQLLGKDYPDTGVRRERNRVALAVLCKGEQQRTLMLTDEYGSLPSFPSSHFRPITVPVFVV